MKTNFKTVLELNAELLSRGYHFEFSNSNSSCTLLDEPNKFYKYTRGDSSLSDLCLISEIANSNGYTITCKDNYIYCNIGNDGFIGTVVNGIRKNFDTNPIIDKNNEAFIYINSFEDAVILERICKKIDLKIKYKMDNSEKGNPRTKAIFIL